MDEHINLGRDCSVWMRRFKDKNSDMKPGEERKDEFGKWKIRAVISEIDTRLYSYITIRDMVFESDVRFPQGDISEVKRFKFERCVFKNKLLFRGIRIKGVRVVFSSCEFIKGIIVNNSELDSIMFKRWREDTEDNEIQDESEFKNCGIQITSSSLNRFEIGAERHSKQKMKECIIDGLEITSAFIIKGYAVSYLEMKNVIFDDDRQSDIIFKNVSFDDFFIENFNCKFNDIAFEKACFDSLDIGPNSFKGKCNIINSKIADLNIEGFLRDQDVTIQNITLNSLQLIDLRIDRSLKLLGIAPDNNNGTILVKNSDLENCWIYNTEINKFKHVVFQESIFTNAKLENITWKRDYDISDSQDMRNKIEIWKKKREFHRQIKANYEKQSDRALYLEHKALETNLLMKELFYSIFSKKIYNPIKWARDLFDLLILFLNFLTNQNGLNPLQAIFVLLIGSIGMSFWLINTYSPDVALNNFSDFFIIHWQLFNPGHLLSRIEGLKNAKATAYTYFVDVIYRAFLAYMFVQVVSAARKYTK